jgi:hypothetical protein
VQAIDEYGAIQETGVRVFYTNNTNPVWPGWLKGYVFDSDTYELISDARISVGEITEFLAGLGGYYLGIVPAGTHTMTVTAEGYYPKSFSNVTLSSGEIITKNFELESIILTTKGDINRDSNIDLIDAILSLQALSGIDTSGKIPSHYEMSGADVDNDGKIGFAEAIFILQDISGLR